VSVIVNLSNKQLRLIRNLLISCRVTRICDNTYIVHLQTFYQNLRLVSKSGFTSLSSGCMHWHYFFSLYFILIDTVRRHD
jgi:hypothetical protein